MNNKVYHLQQKFPPRRGVSDVCLKLSSLGSSSCRQLKKLRPAYWHPGLRKKVRRGTEAIILRLPDDCSNHPLSVA